MHVERRGSNHDKYNMNKRTCDTESRFPPGRVSAMLHARRRGQRPRGQIAPVHCVPDLRKPQSVSLCSTGSQSLRPTHIWQARKSLDELLVH